MVLLWVIQFGSAVLLVMIHVGLVDLYDFDWKFGGVVGVTSLWVEGGVLQCSVDFVFNFEFD